MEVTIKIAGEFKDLNSIVYVRNWTFMTFRLQICRVMEQHHLKIYCLSGSQKEKGILKLEINASSRHWFLVKTMN